MCGLAGFFQPSALDHQAVDELTRMTSAIAYRGPDSSGTWIDAEAGIALGHRRLAIVDLSDAGHQPMVSHSGRYAIAFNGEIYNHADLRTRLTETDRAPVWRGQSDTETLAAGFDAWGIGDTIARSVGMFAIAVWDRQLRVLTLIRDRLGEKPLYYGWQGAGKSRTFLFGSELKALSAHPACTRDIDRSAIVQLMRHGYVGRSSAIYTGIRKLPAGCIASLTHASPDPQVAAYWSGASVARNAAANRLKLDEVDAVDGLEALLHDAVGRQVLADVPLGAFLSGGVDSSLIVALMQRQSSRPVKTFSIGFQEKRYDEAGFAKRVAQHLRTDHTELYVGDEDLRNVVPRLPAIYDEPFADSSQIPTFLVARLARKAVTVALSGDGGDELFCGYDRYRQGAKIMRVVRSLPHPVRAALAGALRGVPQRLLDTLADPFVAVASGKEPNGQRLRRLADYFASRSLDDLHRKLVSRWRFPTDVVIGGNDPSVFASPELDGLEGLSDAEHMMLFDMLNYLPDDILTKVDRATMAHSLECRAPLLDHRVVEYAWSLPANMKHRDGQSKWALRKILYKYVPRELIERPKMGFEVPIASWLRGPLRDWAEELLARDRLSREGYFNSRLIGQKWSEHLSGSNNWGPQLWNVLIFQSWLEESRRAGVHAEQTPAIV